MVKPDALVFDAGPGTMHGVDDTWNGTETPASETRAS